MISISRGTVHRCLFFDPIERGIHGPIVPFRFRFEPDESPFESEEMEGMKGGAWEGRSHHVVGDEAFGSMGKAKKTKKFAQVKRVLNLKDVKQKQTDKGKEAKKVRNVPVTSSALFFKYNTALGPPYQVLVDTNFINFSIKNKIDPVKGMMDCLYAKCTPCVTDCVMAELEKLGQAYRVALKMAKDPRFERLPCTHSGTYADDCLCERVRQHKCYIVATCDQDLRRRIRKIPGVPIMYIAQHRYSIERLPEATMGGAPRV